MEEIPGREERLFREYYLGLLKGELEDEPILLTLKRFLDCGQIGLIFEDKLRETMSEVEKRVEDCMSGPGGDWKRPLTWQFPPTQEPDSYIYRSHCQMYRSFDMAIKEERSWGVLPYGWLEYGRGSTECRIHICSEDVSMAQRDRVPVLNLSKPVFSGSRNLQSKNNLGALLSS